MENMPPRPKAELYVQRGFGEKVTVTCNFITENWKVILRYLTILLLPVSIVQAFGSNASMSILIGNVVEIENGTAYTELLAPYVLAGITSVVGSLLLSALVYSLMLLYADRAEGLQGVTFADLKPYLVRTLKRAGKALLYLLLLIVVAVLLCAAFNALSPVLVGVLVLAFLVCCVPLALFMPAYLLHTDQPGGFSTIGWCFRNGFRFWGGTFLIAWAMTIIASVVQGVCAMPWYMGMILAVDGLGVSVGESPVMTTLMYLLCIVQVYGSYLAAVLPALALGYQYGHIREKTEAVSVDADIRDFEHL